MTNTDKTMGTDDLFNLSRFTDAQEGMYDTVLSELRNGQKRSHWMWYIFPQIDGLGRSATARLYAIKSLEETRKYLEHPLLGTRLTECAKTVLDIEGRTVSEIFGSPDDMKLRSSMTLFAIISGQASVFDLVLDKYFNGHRDHQTLNILEAMNKNDDVRTL